MKSEDRQMKWLETLHDEYRVNLTPETADRWYKELDQSLNGGSDSELSEAIRFASQQPENKATTHTIDLHTLRIWVKWYRKNRSEQRQRGFRAGSEDAFLAQIKSAMRDAADHAMRWDIMCDPRGLGVGVRRDTTVDECDELYAWAKETWSDWDDAITTVHRNMATELRRVFRTLSYRVSESDLEQPALRELAVQEIVDQQPAGRSTEKREYDGDEINRAFDLSV